MSGRILAMEYVLRFKTLFFSVVIFSAASSSAKDSFELYREGQVGKAIESLKAKNTPAANAKGITDFTLGVWSQELSRWKEAEQFLYRSSKRSSSRDAYVHFLVGKGKKELNDFKGAKKSFAKALKAHPPRNISNESRFQLGQVAMSQSHWVTAYKHLKFVERKWRNTPRHPEVLWSLIKVDLKRKKKWRACGWARKIYSKYPSHPLIYDWGMELGRAKFEGKELGCVASKRDRQSRVNRLQWAGESDRARREIDGLKEKSGKKKNFVVDEMLANYLVREGFVDEALKLMLSYYKEMNKDFGYLMSFARSAAKAGEFQTAVGGYYKAYKRKPRSRYGRRALFRAAFLSYQFQDYDGAARKFEEFVGRYKRSGLRRDAQWHLAWLKYLRGDYSGATQSFKYVLNQKKRYHRRWRKYPVERIKYWLGMSYLKQQQYRKAQEVFVKLMDDRLMGYYSLAAQHRYNSIPGVTPIKNLHKFDRELASLNDSLSILEVPAVILPETQTTVVSEEDESEDNLRMSGEEEKAAESEKVEGVADKDDAEEAEVGADSVMATVFRSPKMQKRFERANQFISMGLNDWAKWELYEIERRTRNPDYLKKLVQTYEKIGSYNRSSYIGAIYFSPQRKREVMEKTREYWQFTYPRAFSSSVENYSKKFGVPEEFIWAIMRAESNYKPDVVSPVGAKGLMQLMPHTAKQVARLMGDVTFHGRQLGDPDVNIKVGTRYLFRLLRKFKFQLPLAAASYNAGPHRVESWLSSFGNLDMDEFIEHIPFVETRNYVKKVSRNYAVYSHLYSGRSQSLEWLAKPVPVRLDRRPSARETWETIE